MSTRARELERIQAIGRFAAEARTPDELFRRTLTVLLGTEPLDLVGVARRSGGGPELLVVPARPFAEEAWAEVRHRVARLLRAREDEPLEVRLTESEAYDPACGARRTVDEPSWIVVPLIRQGQPGAWLIAVPESGVPEERFRVLYSTANQLSLHLERILSARKVEAGRFRAILESMPQAVFLLDDRSRIVQANRSATRLLEELGLAGIPAGRELLEQLRLGEGVDELRHGARSMLEAEVTLPGARVLDASVTPLAGDAPGEGRLLLVLNDVTERRQLQSRLAHSEKMSSLGQMISGVAHELNNPLSTILGFTQLLGSAAADEKLSRRMKLLHEEALRCRDIVQNLLSFARRREPERTPLSINEVIASVAALLRYQLRVDNVAIETETGDVPALLGDRHELQQVFVNLVTNARHAIRASGGGGKVVLRSSAAGREVVVEVSDSGPGVPAGIRSRVFDPFFTTKADGEGTGLGLSLVYGIVTSHGGTIEVVDTPGGGATFRMVFPAHAGRRAQGDAPDRSPREEPIRAVAEPRARILVVDDETRFASLVCEALQSDGHSAVSAADGREALERIAGARFDVVVSDIKMPGMDGWALCREIARVTRGNGPHVVLTTGDTLGRDTEAFARESGAELLRKPFELDELRALVRRRLRPDEDI